VFSLVLASFGLDQAWQCKLLPNDQVFITRSIAKQGI
jgi:hypothetical protein